MSLEAQLNQGMKLLPRHFDGVLNLPVFGNVFYVNSVTGSSTNSGTTPSDPFATLQAAVSAAVTSNNDVIIVMPGHAETVTAVITVNKIGLSIIGVGNGMRRPAITGSGTIDVLSVTAANVLIENINFPAPLVDAATADINVAAAGCVIRNTRHIGSVATENKVDIITVASGGDDLLVDGVSIYNTVVDCVSAISLEAAVARPVLRNLLIQGTFSTAAIMDEATATLVTIEKSIIKNIKAATAVLSFSNNSTGICSFLHVSGRHTTFASNIVPGTGMDFFQTFGTEEAALNGLISPAADAD